MPNIPSIDEIRAVLNEVVAPLREEIAQLRAREDNISIPEAAERLGVSERTIKRMIENKELESLKVRGRRVVRLSTFDPLPEKIVEIAHKARKR
jgi:excisionase family DNA binding protein